MDRPDIEDSLRPEKRRLKCILLPVLLTTVLPMKYFGVEFESGPAMLISGGVLGEMSRE
jgi:hypothetical protein